MKQDNSEDAPRPEVESHLSHGSGEAAADDTRGIDLSGLLGGLLGSAGEQSGKGSSSGSLGDQGWGGLLEALIGGGDAANLDGVVENTGVSQSAVAAILPLIAGALMGQGHEASATRAALDDLAEGRAGAADALAGTGLLQEIMRKTGLSQAGALGVIMAVLKALGLGKTSTSTHAKPKPKPGSHATGSAKPKPKPSSHATASAKPKPKPSASAAAEPKPKPKPSSHSTSSAKPKPKPSGHTTSARPKAKPRPKRSGEVGAGGEETGEEAAA